MMRTKSLIVAGALLLSFCSIAVSDDKAVDTTGIQWPPELPGVANGTITIKTNDFLAVPEDVKKESEKPGSAPYEMAKTAPSVTLFFHQNLGENPAGRTLWSAWGDIALTEKGKVYCGIGDHHKDCEGDARCFIYCYDPAKKSLDQVVNMNEIIPPKAGRPSWSKVHSKVEEGNDGMIYFSCTLNDGQHAADPAKCKWDETLPGGQMYQYDPETKKVSVYFTLTPAPRCTATSLFDKQRNIWWCNLEANGHNQIWGVNMATKEEFYRSPMDAIGFNRCLGVSRDGSIYFNGPSNLAELTKTAEAEAAKEPDPGKSKAKLRELVAKAQKEQKAPLMKIDFATKKIVPTKTEFVGTTGARCLSRETSDGYMYGVTYATYQLFRYSVKDGTVEMLGPSFLTGKYTTLMELSPDEKFVYYMPGAHGDAHKFGTPIVQYNIAKGTQKVLAFLRPGCEQACDYIPTGTYGVKLTPDGGTMYINFNGDSTESHLAPGMKLDGFGLTSFAVIQIPPEERQ